MASDLEMITDEEQISLIVLREAVVASINVACTGRVKPVKTCKMTANNMLDLNQALLNTSLELWN